MAGHYNFFKGTFAALDSGGAHIVLLRTESGLRYQVKEMDKKVEEAKENALAIQKGLRSMGANRTVALSVHVTKEVLADMEEKIALLIEQLDSL
jgi:hypothetical protein